MRHTLAPRLIGWAGTLLMAVMLMVPAGRSAAQPPVPPGGPEYRSLGLSPEQMRRVRQLQREISQRLRTLEQQLREQRRALEAVYSQYDINEERARRLNEQINTTQRAILDTHMRLQVELRKILTEEQFTRFRANIEERRENQRGRWKAKPR